MTDLQFWDDRAKKGTFYRGEYFYTITPLPFYVKRRKLLLKMVLPYIQQANDVFDLGCGDGWYINYFNLFKNGRHISGLDISNEMVTKAKDLNPDSEIYKSNEGIIEENSYDLVYSFAVIAHIKDDMLSEFFFNVGKALRSQGKFIMFEQVSPFQYGGKEFTRRTIHSYKKAASENGFVVESAVLFSFDAHRFFERHLAKFYYKILGGGNMYDKRLKANSHKFFRFLSSLFLLFDRDPLKKDAETGWGNILLILKKN